MPSPGSAWRAADAEVGRREAQLAPARVAALDDARAARRRARAGRARPRRRRARAPRAPRSSSMRRVLAEGRRRARRRSRTRARRRASSATSPVRSWPKRKSSPDHDRRARSSSTSTRSTNASADSAASAASKVTHARDVDARARRAPRVAGRASPSRRGARAGVEDLGRVRVEGRDAPPRRRVGRVARPRAMTRWWPRCSPSKTPMATTVRGRASPRRRRARTITDANLPVGPRRPPPGRRPAGRRRRGARSTPTSAPASSSAATSSSGTRRRADALAAPDRRSSLGVEGHARQVADAGRPAGAATASPLATRCGQLSRSTRVLDAVRRRWRCAAATSGARACRALGQVTRAGRARRCRSSTRPRRRPSSGSPRRAEKRVDRRSSRAGALDLDAAARELVEPLAADLDRRDHRRHLALGPGERGGRGRDVGVGERRARARSRPARRRRRASRSRRPRRAVPT